jgi:hypothetical protein
MYVTKDYVCFASPVNNAFKLIIPFSEITKLEKKKTAGILDNAIDISTAATTATNSSSTTTPTSCEVHHHFSAFRNQKRAYNLINDLWQANSRVATAL